MLILKKIANKTHFDMGKDIRKFIKKQGGTLPEELPTPKNSIKEIRCKDKKKLK